MTDPEVSIVIPTFNEAENICELLDQLSKALSEDLSAEIIFVDDSTDDTPNVIAAAANLTPVPVRLHRRTRPTGGLGAAVVEGMRLASAPWVVVMDADLQHPPELVPTLVAAGVREGADLVVASRYTCGGTRAGLFGRYRHLVSAATTRLTKLIFARPLRGISDPMSGFFAIRRDALRLDELRPLGYKILLELAVRTAPKRVVEVPYSFGERFAGESKSTMREGVRFLRHLAGLRLGVAQARVLAMAMIGISGVLPNLGTLWLLTDGFGVHYLPAAVVANQVAIGWNFVLTDLLLFGHRRGRRRFVRVSSFFALNNADLLVRLPMLAFLVNVLHLGALLGTAITLLVMFIARLLVTEKIIYLRTLEPSAYVAKAETP